MKKLNRTFDHAVVTSFGRSASAEAAMHACVVDIKRQSCRKPTLLLMVGGGKLCPEVLRATLAHEFPGVPVVGGAAAGVISMSDLGCTGLEVGLLAFLDPAVTPRLHFTTDLQEGDFAGGKRLGLDAQGSHTAEAAVLLLYDSVRSFNPRQLHLAAPLLDGFYSAWPGPRTAVGGGLLTDLNMSDSWMLLDGQVRHHSAAALVFPPGVTMSVEVLRACRPVSTYMTITRIEGAQVFELDGLPALEVIEERIGGPLLDGAGRPTRVLTIGEKLDDPWELGDPEDFVNRLILTGDRATGSITLFEPDFVEGSMVQLMQHDGETMVEAARQGALAAQRPLAKGAAKAILRLYIDCAGRISMVSGTATEEAQVVTETITDGVPFLGFYSGVEIAPVRGISRPLDWTGVLATLWFTGPGARA